MSPPPPPIPPAPGGYPRPLGREDALTRVGPPTILLMVLGGIGAAWNLLSIVLNLLGVGLRGLAGRGADERMVALFSGGLGIVVAILGVALYGVVLFGALKMKALQSYGLAIAASIIALLPCCPSCLLGIPAGVWALVVLLNENVRASFS